MPSRRSTPRLKAVGSKEADPEDPDEYRALNIFWVPPEARWSHLKAQAKQPTIGQLVDDAMAGIERDNPSLKGVLPKDYARPALDKQRLGQLIDLISNIGLGDKESRAKDVLGRVYEYFLSQFASAEGKKGGEFYTPRCVVKLLVEMLAPYKGRVFDPCCGSGGMFVQSTEFVARQGQRQRRQGEGRHQHLRPGVEPHHLAAGEDEPRDPRHRRQDRPRRQLPQRPHPDLKADFILANPPFNDSDWGGERLREDKRWKYGVPPAGNANFAWVQHFIHHLAPTGIAGFVLANGSMSSNQSGEGEIRKAIVEADLVDCMIALPGQLFYSTQIPVCLWFLARDKKNGRFRDRRGHVLFIDARKLGAPGRPHAPRADRRRHRADRRHLPRLARRAGSGEYADVAGFCKSATLEEIRCARPRPHARAATSAPRPPEDDGEPFEEKMKRLTIQLREQMEEGRRLDEAISGNLKELGYGS